MMLMYCIVCMSSWMPDLELKFRIGYVAIGFVVLHLLFHMSMMTCSLIKTKVTDCKRWKRKREHQNKRKALQSKLRERHALRRARSLKIRDINLLQIESI